MDLEGIRKSFGRSCTRKAIKDFFIVVKEIRPQYVDYLEDWILRLLKENQKLKKKADSEPGRSKACVSGVSASDTFTWKSWSVNPSFITLPKKILYSGE